ncbi:MAG: hypothetical protein M3Y72_25340 [Acidobacteriota bacterium]|nr:hypothetical protein [Acidobacteriota bacterium]
MGALQSYPPFQFSLSAYRQLAEFRASIRQFLHFSEQAARGNGFEPQQHHNSINSYSPLRAYLRA